MKLEGLGFTPEDFEAFDIDLKIGDLPAPLRRNIRFQFAKRANQLLRERLNKSVTVFSSQKSITLEEFENRRSHGVSERYEELDSRAVRHALLKAVGESDLIKKETHSVSSGFAAVTLIMRIAVLAPDHIAL